MVSHRLALNDFGGVVVLKGERILGSRDFVGDFTDVRKCGVHKLVRDRPLSTEVG